MPAYNKVFFHAGPVCSCTGIGALFGELDKANIAFGHKTADEYGTAWEASQYANATTVWRLTTKGQNDGHDYDVPDYSLAPADAALKHWLITKAKLPPEFNKNTWIEPINEVDKERADWLGYFALAIANMANSEGYKVSLFSFSAGEPEADDWETPGMLAYLEYCADHPNEAAVSLHEYSLTKADLFEGFPYLVGRFQFLHDVCDDNGIARPTIFISEFGWEYQNVPDVPQAMTEIGKAAELYAAHPNIRFAAIWYLGGGSNWPNIGQQTQKLIEPIKTYTLTAEFPDPPIIEEPTMDCNPRVPYGRKYLVAPQDATLAEWIEICEAAFPGRNSVTFSYDDAGHAPGVTSNTAVLYGVPAELRQSFLDWYTVHYPGTAVQFAVDVPPAPPLEIFDIVDQLPKHATLKYPTRPLDAITTLTIHHTVSPPDRSIESIAAYHVSSNGWPGIGYHYVIKDDGRIFQTNYLTTKSYHAGSAAAPGDENYFSVGISLQGDFTNAPPPQAQQDAVRELVANLRDNLPGVTAVLGHRQMPGAATQCPGNTWASWLPYVAGGEIVQPEPEPPPPPPPVGQLVDMTQYYLPPNGRTYGDISIKPTNWGQGDVRQQLQLHGGYLFVTKGGEFEKRMILDGRIYFLMDDSPGDGKYYTVNSPTGWIPAQWAVGQTFTRQETTTFYHKANCQPTGEESNWTNVMLFKALYAEWTSPHGLKLTNVAHLQWLVNGVVEENYWLGKNLGYVGWSNRHGRESWIKEIIPYTDQEPNKFAGSCYHPAFG